ncbi:MAG: tail protein X [Clostridium sp.]
MNQYFLYSTLEGDTFDSISLDFYDDEYHSIEIMKVNPKQAKILIFSEGIELKIPIIDIQEESNLPPWKR